MPGAINNGSAVWEAGLWGSINYVYSLWSAHVYMFQPNAMQTTPPHPPPPTPHTDAQNALQVCVVSVCALVVGGYWHYLHREMRLQSRQR